MPNFLRLPLFTACVLIGAAHADTSEQTAEPNWLDNTRAACAQQYSSEQCQDDEFLNEKFHVRDLQTAHNTATRRQQQEQRALRELLLQRTCGSPATYCANNPAEDCAAQLQQMCASLQQQAATCVSQTVAICADGEANADCVVQRLAQCPSAKKQSVDKLLAKYPKLSTAQQIHIRQVAQQIDSNQSGWIGNLFSWLGL